MGNGATTRTHEAAPVVGRGLVAVAVCAAFAAALIVFAGFGGPDDGLVARAATVLDLVVRAGGAASAYVLAGVGLGELFAPLLKGTRAGAALRGALGLGVLLTVSHGLGVLGLLSGTPGFVAGAAPVVLGLVLLLSRMARAKRLMTQWSTGRTSLSLAAVIVAAALGLMVVAAASPPGWLWGSEAGAYDALEYHLELPKEWLGGGRVWPVGHNVYSYLPGYVEAAFTHLGAMTGAGRPGGMLAGDGWRLIACQMMSAGFAVFAAVMVAQLAAAAARQTGWRPGAGGADRASVAGVAAGALLLCTPWTVVIGSLAYNDLAMLAFTAAAMLAAIDGDLRPVVRGGVTGALVGFACCCKPTALFLAGLPAGVLLLSMLPRRGWAGAAVSGAMTGGLTIAPWLARNWVAVGNPVFPFGAAVFGADHWSAEQVARYVAAHGFHGTLMDRLRLLFLPDPSDPAGPVHRGLLHPQWFAFFPLVCVGGVVAWWRGAGRMSAWLAVALGVQLAAWLFLTHVQSRFLLPLAASGCALVGLALASFVRPGDAAGAGARSARRGAVPVAAVLISLVCIPQLGASAVIFSRQRNGAPNAMLVAGPGVRTGQAFAGAEREQAAREAGPEVFVNLTTAPGERVYLLGDATPLYYTAPVVFNTTYDTWPMGQAIRAAPGDPAAWSRELRRRGISRVLVDYSELGRLARSGWIDPAVTPEAVTAWLKSGPRVLRQWPELGYVLVELPELPG